MAKNLLIYKLREHLAISQNKVYRWHLSEVEAESKHTKLFGLWTESNFDLHIIHCEVDTCTTVSKFQNQLIISACVTRHPLDCVNRLKDRKLKVARLHLKVPFNLRASGVYSGPWAENFWTISWRSFKRHLCQADSPATIVKRPDRWEGQLRLLPLARDEQISNAKQR